MEQRQERQDEVYDSQATPCGRDVVRPARPRRCAAEALEIHEVFNVGLSQTREIHQNHRFFDFKQRMC